MFWKTLGLNYLEERKKLDKKLDSPNVTLKEVLADEYCLQEIRSFNQKLLGFLRQEQVLREMIDAILSPATKDVQDQELRKIQYKFIHQCTEAVCLASGTIYPELAKYPDLMDKLVNFLRVQAGNLDHLLVSFYCKIIISFLSMEPEAFLDILEHSDFLDQCLTNLEYCAIFELLCTMAHCLPDPSFREKIKKWYLEKGFVDQLLNQFTSAHSSSIHENVAAIWCEFIKALREIQCNVEVAPDPLLELIQSEESVRKLLSHMFPTDQAYSPSIIANGSSVLNTLLETNDIKNSPASIIEREQRPLDLMSAHTSQDTGLDMDPNRVAETLCAERAEEIVKVILYCMERPPDDFYGDVMAGCMQLLANLLNTNHLPTHVKLHQVFSADETSIAKLCGAVINNPLCSVFNSLLTNIIFYILHSSSDDENPLTLLLIKDLNLPRVIRLAVKSTFVNDRPRLARISVRSFFMHIADRLVKCQANKQQGEYIDSLIKGLPDYEEWQEFSTTSLKDFMDQNRSDKIHSVTTRSSTTIDVDEIKDQTFSFETNFDL